MPPTDITPPAEPAAAGDLRAAGRVSAVALSWTLAAGAAGAGLGIATHSLALLAFGGVGVLDAVGSATLVLHFRHAARHDVISARFEAFALRVVTTGMLLIGLATVGLSAHRLATHGRGEAVPAGAALAAVSVLALGGLTVVKRRIARAVGSPALAADAWLSAMGSVLALVTLAGTGLTLAFGWWWVDPAAALAIGAAAVVLSVALRPTPPGPEPERPGGRARFRLRRAAARR